MLDKCWILSKMCWIAWNWAFAREGPAKLESLLTFMTSSTPKRWSAYWKNSWIDWRQSNKKSYNFRVIMHPSWNGAKTSAICSFQWRCHIDGIVLHVCTLSHKPPALIVLILSISMSVSSATRKSHSRRISTSIMRPDKIQWMWLKMEWGLMLSPSKKLNIKSGPTLIKIRLFTLTGDKFQKDTIRFISSILTCLTRSPEIGSLNLPP